MSVANKGFSERNKNRVSCERGFVHKCAKTHTIMDKTVQAVYLGRGKGE